MTSHFDEVYQFIKNQLDKGNILVHCGAGISRVTIPNILVKYLCDCVFDEREGVFLSQCSVNGEKSEISCKSKPRFQGIVKKI